MSRRLKESYKLAWFLGNNRTTAEEQIFRFRGSLVGYRGWNDNLQFVF